MVLPNIRLYESLKKDLSEESARMIAEIVPQAADLATKSDISALKVDAARLEQVLEATEARLRSHVDSRLLR